MKHVPMLYDFPALIESENIYRGVVIATWPVLTAMDDDEVTFGHNSFYLDVPAGKLSSHLFKISNEPCLSGFDVRVVLNVIIANIEGHSLARQAIVEHHLVEGNDIRLVLFEIDRHDSILNSGSVSGNGQATRTAISTSI